MIKRLIPLYILAVGIAGFLLLKMTRPEPEVVSPRERSWQVEVMAIRPTAQKPVLPLYGQLVAPEQTTLSAPLAGRIARRPVREGQQVSAGELLVAFDEADVQPVLAQAEADVADLQAQIEAERIRYRNDRAALGSEQEILDNARKQLERTRSLVSRKLSSQEDLDAASDAVARARLTVTVRQRAVAEHPSRLQSLTARLARAEAALASAQRDSVRSQMTAPFDGVVIGIQVAPGDQVARNTPLLSLYPVRGLELRARVPDLFRPELQAALAAGQSLQAHSPATAHRFVLSRFAGTSAPAGTEAILALEGEARGLRPGGLLAVNLERPERKDAVAIPYSALYGSDSVYLVTDEGRMRLIRIQRIGEALSGDGERRVLVAGEALEPGARLIITHLPNAMTGLKVQVADTAGGGAE